VGSRALDRSSADAAWSELLHRSSAGDAAAFAELYDASNARVYGVALRLLRSPDHAAEVTQEVYVEVWRHAARYHNTRGSVLGWLTMIAHRRAVDRIRSVSTAKARDHRYAAYSLDRDVDLVWDGVVARAEAAQVRAALTELTAVQREALTLAYFGGHTQTQVAVLLRLPLGTVKTRIRDGLSALRATFARNAPDDALPELTTARGGPRMIVP
jgi:RNA polymerase sigma-70 factor (ECF subfamily)